MKRIVLVGIVLALVGLTTQAGSSSVVDPKVILELQPQFHELGDMFNDDTVQQMLNRGYTHVANFKADVIGGLTMEVLGAELEASGYGVLLYGAHGGPSGEIGGETFSSYDDADVKMQWLITWQYFDANSLTIRVNPAQSYYMLAFTTAYTNSAPAGCDVAIVS